jgi:hypothetical protein
MSKNFARSIIIKNTDIVVFEPTKIQSLKLGHKKWKLLCSSISADYGHACE